MNKADEDDPTNLSSVNLHTNENIIDNEYDSCNEGATPSAIQPGGDESPPTSPIIRNRQSAREESTRTTP